MSWGRFNRLAPMPRRLSTSRKTTTIRVEYRAPTILFNRGKCPQMGAIAGKLADYTILTSDNPRSEKPDAIISEIEKGMKDVAPNKFTKIGDRRDVGRIQRQRARPSARGQREHEHNKGSRRHELHRTGNGGHGRRGTPYPEATPAGVAELVDAAGLGPAGPRGPWRFESSRPHYDEPATTGLCPARGGCARRRRRASSSRAP